MNEFRNESNLTFIDISSEVYRKYYFANGVVVHIGSPLKLNVSESGGHRIFDAFNKCHYIPKGWVHLQWEAKPDQPHFVK